MSSSTVRLNAARTALAAAVAAFDAAQMCGAPKALGVCDPEACPENGPCQFRPLPGDVAAAELRLVAAAEAEHAAWWAAYDDDHRWADRDDMTGAPLW